MLLERIWALRYALCFHCSRCGVCYNYTVEEIITGYEEVPTGNEVADLEACQAYLDVVFPGTPASEPLCIALGQTM